MPNREERQRPHHCEIEDERHEDPENGSGIGNDIVALICKQDEDGVEKADKSQRREYRNEPPVQKFFACQTPDRISRYDTPN